MMGWVLTPIANTWHCEFSINCVMSAIQCRTSCLSPIKHGHISMANISFNSHRIVVANVCSTTSKIEKYKNIVIFMWGRGSKKGPSAYYKIFQDGASRLMHAVKMAHVIKNSDHINTMNGQTIISSV